MMNPSTLHPTSRWRAVVEEQFRSVGIAIRGVVAVAGALTLAITLFLIAEAIRVGEGIPVVPELAFLLALAALLLPIAVWRGGYYSRRSYLATMPVGQSRHTLTKVAAGWIWLMVLVAVFLLWMFAVAVVTGGQIGVDEMRILASDLPSGARAADLDAFARRWTTPHWRWAVFFTGATGAYLIGSAVLLATSRTRRWLAGIAVICLFVTIADDQAVHLGGAAERLETLIVAIVGSRYGLAQFLAMTDAYYLTTAAGEEVVVWSFLPTLEAWLVATPLWIGLAVASLMAVVWFDRKD